MQSTETTQLPIEQQYEIFHEITKERERIYGFDRLFHILLAIFFILVGILFDGERWRNACFFLGALIVCLSYYRGATNTALLKKAKRLLDEGKLSWQSFHRP